MNLKEIIKELERKYGEGTIMKFSDVKTNVDVIPTGSISLDHALGVGGIPRGRIIEIYGPESSGKTTLALSIISQAQKKKLKCAFVDAEHSLDPDYAKNIGVDLTNLFISQPNSGEQALDVVEGFVKSGEIGLVVVDSVAALTPQAEIDGDMGQAHIGLQARLMSQAMRKLTALTSRSNTSIIFINQIRMKIGIKWGNPETTSGGTALKFYTSARIEVRRAAKLTKSEEIIGNRVKVKIAKNKLAAPFKEVEFDIIFGKGISYETDVLNYGIKVGVIKKEGISLFYKDKKLGRSVETSRQFLEGNKDLVVEIVKSIEESNDNNKIETKEKQD
jgi:recombination protein RecA